MPLPLVTDDSVLSSLANLLKVAVADLPDYWSAVVTESHTAAVQELYGRLLRRGFTKAQIDAWDRAAEFERDLALYWSMTRGGAYSGFNLETVRALDRRKELDYVQMFVAGKWVQPAEGASGPGTIGVGGPDSQDSIFEWPDPDDPRLGESTRW